MSKGRNRFDFARSLLLSVFNANISFVKGSDRAYSEFRVFPYYSTNNNIPAFLTSPTDNDRYQLVKIGLPELDDFANDSSKQFLSLLAQISPSKRTERGIGE